MISPHNYRPEIIAFCSGALVMIFEILGARIVWPYIGTSLFVWTSLIAVILFALSLGTYIWWKLADKRSDLSLVSEILLWSSYSIFFLIIFNSIFLEFISGKSLDVRVSSIILSLILFAPTSFLLWLIWPIVTKIRMTNLDSTGRVVGKISSIGTVGSIIWTLWAGFFLIPFFWVSTLLILIGFSLVLLSLLCNHKKNTFLQVFIIFSFLLSYLWYHSVTEVQAEKWIYDFDTPYSHITISPRSNEEILDLFVDNVTHAGMHLSSNELVYEYTKYYHLFDTLAPNAQDILMLWWAAYSFPKSFLEFYPNKNLDVVEIDEKMTELAKRFFRLTDDPRLTSYHQDARVYLNSTEKKYDAILGDAFWSYYSIPYQLTTLEVAQKKYDLLNEDGVVLLNIIGSLSWKNAKFLEAEYLTYQTVFPEVFVLPVYSLDPQKVQNIMLVALKNPQKISENFSQAVHQEYLAKKRYLEIPDETQILTDNYAPVDYMVSQMNLD